MWKTLRLIVSPHPLRLGWLHLIVCRRTLSPQFVSLTHTTEAFLPKSDLQTPLCVCLCLHHRTSSNGQSSFNHLLVSFFKIKIKNSFFYCSRTVLTSSSPKSYRTCHCVSGGSTFVLVLTILPSSSSMMHSSSISPDRMKEVGAGVRELACLRSRTAPRRGRVDRHRLCPRAWTLGPARLCAPRPFRASCSRTASH